MSLNCLEFKEDIITVLFYLSSILLANWLVDYFGVIVVGPLVFPAGAVAVGLTFSARDYMHERYGKWRCWIWMMTAAGLTLLLNQKIAVASLTAFAASELVDWVIFSSFSKLSFKKRIVLSNLISTPLDSVLFVSIAFGWAWPVIIGQTVVKFISGLTMVIWRHRD